MRTDLLIDLGRLEDAEAVLADVEEEIARLVLESRLAHERGDLRKALDGYEAVLERWPNNYSVRAHAARAAYGLGEDERALSELREVIRHNRDETDAPLQMAKIHFGLGQFDLASQFAQMQISTRGTTTHEAHAVAAQSLAAQGKIKAAMAVLQSLLDEQDGRFEAHGIDLMATILERYQSPTSALEAVEKALSAPREGNEWGLIKIRRLQLIRNVQGLDAARAAAAKAVAAEPESALLLGIQAQFAVEAGELDEAETLARRAIELDPEAGAPHGALGLVERARGNVDAAIAELDRAAELEPRGGQFSYLIAQTQLAAGNLGEARTRLGDVVRDYPTHAAAANDLAWILANQNDDLDHAARLARRAVRIHGGAETLHTLGFVELTREAYAPAAKALRRAISLAPDHSTARYHLALALSGMNDERGAVEELERALAGPGSFPEQDAAKRELARLSTGAATTEAQ